MSATQTLISGKSKVVNGGTVESQGSGALGSNDRQRHGESGFPALGFENFFNTFQDESPSRTALSCRAGFQLTVHPVGNVDSRSHPSSVPYLWHTRKQSGHNQASIYQDPGLRTGIVPRMRRTVLTSTLVFLGLFTTGSAQGPQLPRLMSTTPKPANGGAKAVRSCESLAGLALPHTSIEPATIDAADANICRVTAITTHRPAVAIENTVRIASIEVAGVLR